MSYAHVMQMPSSGRAEVPQGLNRSVLKRSGGLQRCKGLQGGDGLQRAAIQRRVTERGNRSGNGLRRQPKPRAPRSLNAYEAEFHAARPGVVDRARGRCQAGLDGCRGDGQVVHHRKLRSQGGDNSEANLVLLCTSCHEWAHREVAQAVAIGLIVRGWADPATVSLQTERAA